MRTLMQSFLVMLTTATDWQLTKQVQFLKVENSILRGRLGSLVLVTPWERRELLRFGKTVFVARFSVLSTIVPDAKALNHNSSSTATTRSPQLLALTNYIKQDKRHNDCDVLIHLIWHRPCVVSGCDGYLMTYDFAGSTSRWARTERELKPGERHMVVLYDRDD